MKNSLEIIIKEVRFEGGFKSGGRIRVAEFLSPCRWTKNRKGAGTNSGESVQGICRTRVSETVNQSINVLFLNTWIKKVSQIYFFQFVYTQSSQALK